MQAPSALLKFIAKAFLNAVGGGVAGDFAVEVVPQVANDVWHWWGKGRSPEQARAEVQAAAELSAAEAREQAAELAAAEASSSPQTVRIALESYLEQVPASIRRSQRRPSDPTGRTASSSLALHRPEDVARLLPARLPRFHPGDRPPAIGDWVLEELLGAGGFGEVWRARNPHLPEPVALKFCLDPQAARTLMNEASLLGRVMHQGRHPGIVSLRHTYLGADPPCLEYEYVAGGELTQVVSDARAKGGLPPRQATQVVLMIARVVAFAHGLNPPIVHRDLKPANILVQRSADNKVAFRVADFGIGGAAADQAIAQTRAGVSLGASLASSLRGSYTPLYASPQQVRGCPPDPRDDVYALGVIWYQLLTGDITQEAPRGRSWVTRLQSKGLAEPLIDLLACCIEDDPADRPADAGDLARRLDAIIKGASDEQRGLGMTHYQTGKGHYDKEEYDEAVAAFTEGIRLDPKLALAYLYRGDVHGDEGRLDEALADLDQAILLDPASALAHAYRGYFRSEKGDLDQALADCDRAVALDRNLVEAHRLRGFVLERKGDREEAIASHTEAIRLQPDLAVNYQNRASAYWDGEQYDLALQDLNEAVRLAPADSDLLVTRGVLHFDMGDSKAAIADFTAAIELDPADAQAYLNRGIAAADARRVRAAIADFSKAIELDPGCSLAFAQRGWAHFNREELAEAITDFTEAIRLEPLMGAYNGRGWARFKQKAFDQAAADFTEAVRLDATHASPFYGRASCRRETGDVVGAIEDYSEACRLGPDEAAHFYERGLLHSRQGRHEQAAADFSEAIRLARRWGLPYTARGAEYIALGRHQEAIDDLDKAVKYNRDHALSHFLRGQAHEKLGNLEAARADSELARKLDPGVADAKLEPSIVPGCSPRRTSRKKKPQEE
jgi:tetratricopeptide (TPR) repeat protein